MAVETVSRIISDQSGWEVEEGNHAEMRLVFPDGTTYNIDLSTDEANTFLNGLTNKPWPEKTQASKAKANKAKGGPKRPSFGPKGAAGKLAELKADAAKAKAYFADKDAAWFDTALKNASSDVKQAWTDLRASH